MTSKTATKTTAKPATKTATKTTTKTTTKPATKKKSLTVEDTYKKKTHHEHILSVPDTYIGSVATDEKPMYIFSRDMSLISEEIIRYIAGFFKLFDEILMNARDHTVRDSTCKNIKLSFDRKTGEIVCWNDGVGIPVDIHEEYQLHVPEMIFGHLLTSSNYDQKGKTVGGKNGYGAKLTNIYSKQFVINTIGVNRLNEKKHYVQTFRNNMYDIEKPVIKNVDPKAKTFTEIRYIPDYEKFCMPNLTDDMHRLLVKRCYDIAACTPSSVRVWIDGTEIKTRDLKSYIGLYYEKKPNMVCRQINSRWEVGIVFSPDNGDRYISFVNGISTYQGGTHVNHVVDNVVRKVTNHIKSIGRYKNLKIQPATIKQYLTFYINCVIEDPGFNSQVKEYMNSKISDWCSCGSDCPDTKCEIPDDMIRELCENGLMKEVVELSEFKEMKELSKTDGKKTTSVRGVDKLIDAKWAGTRKSRETALILTEGDSAKAFAVSGLSIIGNDRYGVFPLKGKLLNVRNKPAKQIKANTEFTNLKQIIGLKQGKTYPDTTELRYGSVIILTDQDPDGSHIKGLIINMFEVFWPSLLQIDGFIKTINTPIIKAWKKNDRNKESQKIFYTISDFQKWSTDTLKGDLSKWNYKYYKGLGTSTEKEAIESFVDFDERLISFIWENEPIDDMEKKSETNRVDGKDSNEGDEQDEQDEPDQEVEDPADNQSEDSNQSIDYSYMKSPSHHAIAKAFDKNKTNDRKLWLKQFDKNNLIEYRGNTRIPYSDFIDKDLIVFSNIDNYRSIPSLVDGMKPSQRKIIYSCFKRGRNSGEVKVAQLAGYVSEHSDYHHGEASLNGAIIGLAQDFPGSNNINLLMPNGNFGFRRLGGHEAASPRYIFTALNRLTNYIFREEDDYILQYNSSDNEQIEPLYYEPIIPICLINGASGIGTGFSTNILPYNPLDIVQNLKRMMTDKEPLDMLPWFRGFKGTVEKVDAAKYKIRGNYTIAGKTLHITEIPIVDGWLEPYEKKLEARLGNGAKDNDSKLEAIDIVPHNNRVDITVTFKAQELQQMIKKGELEKFLAMTQNVSSSNLHLYNASNRLTRYDSVADILRDFYDQRLHAYELRKNYFLAKLKNELDIYKFKVQFINEYIDEIVRINRCAEEEVISQLEERSYPRLAHDHTTPEKDRSYRYLTDMSILTLTTNKIKELENKMKSCEAEYNAYLTTPIKQIWMKELDEFVKHYNKYLDEWMTTMDMDESNKKKEKKERKKKPTAGTAGETKKQTSAKVAGPKKEKTKVVRKSS